MDDLGVDVTNDSKQAEALCSCWHHIGKLDCPVHGHDIVDGNCRFCGSSQGEIDHGLVPTACTGRSRRSRLGGDPRG